MKISRSLWTVEKGWSQQGDPLAPTETADLVLVFGSTTALKEGRVLSDLRKSHPKAYICGGSTAGEISGDRLLDDSATATAVKFKSTKIRAADAQISDPQESFSIGKDLADSVPHEGLAHAFVLSDGLTVNSSELVKGITSILPTGVAVTGDITPSPKTRIITRGLLHPKQVALLGLYNHRVNQEIEAIIDLFNTAARYSLEPSF
jgi:hypothetical protein